MPFPKRYFDLESSSDLVSDSVSKKRSLLEPILSAKRAKRSAITPVPFPRASPCGFYDTANEPLDFKHAD